MPAEACRAAAGVGATGVPGHEGVLSPACHSLQGKRHNLCNGQKPSRPISFLLHSWKRHQSDDLHPGVAASAVAPAGVAGSVRGTSDGALRDQPGSTLLTCGHPYLPLLTHVEATHLVQVLLP